MDVGGESTHTLGSDVGAVGYERVHRHLLQQVSVPQREKRWEGRTGLQAYIDRETLKR